MNFSKAELVQYRLSRAKEAFKDAEILTVSKSWNAAANRLYYACFYAVSAYLALHDIETTTHAGLKAAFNKELIKSGKIDKSHGLHFNRLFGLRQEADYEDFFNVDEAEISLLLPKIQSLLFEIENLIQ